MQVELPPSLALLATGPLCGWTAGLLHEQPGHLHPSAGGIQPSLNGQVTRWAQQGHHSNPD